MRYLVPARYFPLPVLQVASYSMTPLADVEIEAPQEGYIPVRLDPLNKGMDEQSLENRLHYELTKAAVNYQGHTDHQSLRELFGRSAFSQTDAAEQMVRLIRAEVHGRVQPLTPWGSGEVIPEELARLHEARQRPDALAMQAHAERSGLEVTVNTVAYPWPMVLRAISRVFAWAEATAQVLDSDRVRLWLQAHDFVNLAELAEWVEAEVKEVGKIQAALYLPAHRLEDTYVKREEEKRDEPAATR